MASRIADHPGSNAPGVPKGGKSGRITKGDAAKLLNVSKSHVRMAREVVNKAPAEVVAKVEAGEMKVGAAWREHVEEKRPTAARLPMGAPASGSLLDEIANFIASVASRNVTEIPQDARVRAAKDFARVLKVADAARAADWGRARGSITPASRARVNRALEQSKPPSADGDVAAFLASGGTITKLPTAAVAPSNGGAP